ncbi:hypothetical protein LSTR_LSTR012819 [Laodelphax striatellus]|uniref:PLAT domain-containing protein n=1 Tax=Laodelphax striatellus TaxID=195883 RepID=A0A482XDM2_LAOST|nr:hypothetical protein LSTR_LSTR012819 [Laodelphax striatellus]
MSYGTAQYDFTSNRPCQKMEDCGRGEYCLANSSSSSAVCQCGTPQLPQVYYMPDANGICDKVITDTCAKLEKAKCIGGRCLNLLGSYYCVCGPDSKGSNCELKQNDGSVKRASNIAVAFTVVDRYLTDRMFLFFVESFGTDFELTFNSARYRNKIIEILAKETYLPKDFILFQSARNECLRVKISKDVCMMVPDTKPLDPFPKMFMYRIFLILKNNNEVQFQDVYSLTNVVEQRCLPTASMENCGSRVDNMVRKPRGSSLRIKVSVFPSNHCDEPKNIFSEWKLYKVSSNFNVKMVNPPLDYKVGGTYYDIGAFSYPTGLYRIEVWLTALVSNNNDVQTGSNFAYCYFEIVDMPLQAAIEGGASRSVGQGASLTLDASASYDHNTPTRGDLRYLWSCDADIAACKEREVADPLFEPALDNFGGEITFTLKAKSSMNGIISMPVSQKITFSDTDIPELSIQCLKNCGIQEYPARVAEAIYLQVIDLKHGLRDFDVTWKGFDENGQEIQGFENMKEGGHYRHQLIVKENSLSSGKKYTFVAEGGGNPPGRASYQVRMANDVIIGDCEFKPENGTKMTTRFKIECHEFGTTVVPNILRYELYNVLPGKYQMDLSLGSFLTGDILDVLFFSDDIYIKVCDIFENCGKKKLKLKIPMNEYRQVEQLSAYIHLVLQSMSDAFETYVPADVIATASELLNKITYSLNYKIEILSYSLYDDYIKDFLTPAKHMVSSIEAIFASRNKLIEKHEEEHPTYAETVYKYRRATKQCIASLELISSSLAQGLLQGQKEITLNYKEFSFWVKVDTLLKMTHAVPDENDSHVKFSDELANELSKPMDSFSLSVFKLKNDLFWWKDVDDFDINTEFIVATVRKRNSDGTFSGLVEALDNRLDIYLTTKKNKSSLIKGSTAFPPASWDDDKKDKAVTVHRLDIPTFEGQFHIKFVNFENSLRLALEKNMRPDYELLMSDEAKVVNASETEFIVPFEANGGYDFFYIGLLPADDTENVSVEYTIEVFDSSCSSWIGDEWRSGICKPGPIRNNMLNCRCKHLSLFGGSLFVAPNKVDPINDIELFLTVADNPYIAIIVLICLLLYFLLFVWAWRKDKKDESYAKLIKLRDNVPGDTNAYVVIAYTGIRIAAGTTSNVGIQIYGSLTESRAHILKGDDVDRKVLQRGADDWFLLFTPAPLGELERIHLWLDFTGSSPSWYSPSRSYANSLRALLLSFAKGIAVN